MFVRFIDLIKFAVVIQLWLLLLLFLLLSFLPTYFGLASLAFSFAYAK